MLRKTIKPTSLFALSLYLALATSGLQSYLGSAVVLGLPIGLAAAIFLFCAISKKKVLTGATLSIIAISIGCIGTVVARLPAGGGTAGAAVGGHAMLLLSTFFGSLMLSIVCAWIFRGQSERLKYAFALSPIGLPIFFLLAHLLH